MNLILTLALRHILLAGLGSGLIVLTAFAIRRFVLNDAVLRYRLMVSALVACAALVPLQLFVAEVGAPARTAIVSLFDPARASSTQTQLRDDRLDDSATQLAGQQTGQLAEQLAGQQPGPSTDAMTSIGARISPRVAPDLSLTQVTTTSSFRSRISETKLQAVLLGVYVSGAALVMGWILRRAIVARRLLARCRPVRDARVLHLWTPLIAHTHRAPALLECDSLHAPACWPLDRTAVILPGSASTLDDDTLAASLRHELIHIARRDGLIAALASVATALLWFQPLVWVFTRLLAMDREHSCDALVVRATGRPRAYAHALLRFCDPRVSASCHTPLLGFESARSLEWRIHMLARSLQKSGRSRRAALLVVGVAGLAATATAQGLITVLVNPGSLLAEKSETVPNAESTAASTPGTTSSTSPSTSPAVSPTTTSVTTPASTLPAEHARATTVRYAPDDGRSEQQVFDRVMHLQHMREPGAALLSQVPKDGTWVFFAPEHPTTYPKGTFVSDDELIVIATDAATVDGTLRARTLRVRLPGGSKLRAELEGQSIISVPSDDQRERLVLTGGSLRIIDGDGVARVTIKADRDATITWTSALGAGGGIVYDIVAPDSAAGLSAVIDVQTGVPEGELQPQHGSVRWTVTAPPTSGGRAFVDMRWTYDVSEMRGTYKASETGNASGC